MPIIHNFKRLDRDRGPYLRHFGHGFHCWCTDAYIYAQDAFFLVWRSGP